MGLFEILRDTRTLTYQICRIEEKINRTTAEVRDTRDVRNELLISIWRLQISS